MTDQVLSNIRDFLGWIIGRRVVDVTAGDPPGLPDSAGDGDDNFVVLHFDNGGTLDVPLGETGFRYDNPVSAAADRGELCPDCMGGAVARAASLARAYRQFADQPHPSLHARITGISGPGEEDAGPRDTRQFFQIRRAILSDCKIDDATIAMIEDVPIGPQNPHYVKSHTSAPGTVRHWFRTMRAADFARSMGSPVSVGSYTVILRGQTVHIGGDEPWTLFDTQKIVDRETAAHYARPTSAGLWRDLLHKSSHRGRPLESWDVRQHAWDDTNYYRDYFYLGIDRSLYPMFSSKVPTPTRGITREDLRFDPTKVSTAIGCIAPRTWRNTPAPCPNCGGPRRSAPAPETWAPGGAGRLLYHYISLLEADRRYLGGTRVAMCDTCQLAAWESR